MPVFLFFNIQNRGCNPIKNLLQLYKINELLYIFSRVEDIHFVMFFALQVADGQFIRNLKSKSNTKNIHRGYYPRCFFMLFDVSFLIVLGYLFLNRLLNFLLSECSILAPGKPAEYMETE